MFRNVLRTLDEIAAIPKLSFELEADAKGYVDKECPDPRCLFRFKMRPWREDSQVEQAKDHTCPMCGHRAPARSWLTSDQAQQAKELALRKLQGMLNSAMHDDARQFNARQPTNAFVKMSLRVTGGDTFGEQDVPIAAAEAMELEIQCEVCQTDFAVIGSAFFCPCCGVSSADRVFDDALTKIASKRACLDDMRIALESTAGKDQAAVISRSLIESCLLDGVVAFQRFCEITFRKLPGVEESPHNVFQRLHGGSELWRATVGEGYEDWLDADQLHALGVLFQRRHLLAHAEGIVDDKYVAKSGDSTYVAGQRITVTPADVEALLGALSSLVAGIRSAVSRASPGAAK